MHAHVTVEDAAEIAGRILIGNKTKTTGLYYFVQNKTAVAQIGSKPQANTLLTALLPSPLVFRWPESAPPVPLWRGLRASPAPFSTPGLSARNCAEQSEGATDLERVVVWLQDCGVA